MGGYINFFLQIYPKNDFSFNIAQLNRDDFSHPMMLTYYAPNPKKKKEKRNNFNSGSWVLVTVFEIKMCYKDKVAKKN